MYTFSSPLTICHWLILEIAWQFLLLSAELQGRVLHISNEQRTVLCILLLGSSLSSGRLPPRVGNTFGRASQSNPPPIFPAATIVLIVQRENIALTLSSCKFQIKKK